MKTAALACAVVFTAACGRAAAVSSGPPPGDAGATVILANDGGVLRPIANGGRVTLRTGSASVRFVPYPVKLDGDLDVALFDANGRPVAGDVKVYYESIDMDHDRITARGVRHGDAYRVPFSFLMPGAWRLVITVGRPDDGTSDRFVLMLPQVP